MQVNKLLYVITRDRAFVYAVANHHLMIGAYHSYLNVYVYYHDDDRYLYMTAVPPHQNGGHFYCRIYVYVLSVLYAFLRNAFSGVFCVGGVLFHVRCHLQFHSSIYFASCCSLNAR